MKATSQINHILSNPSDHLQILHQQYTGKIKVRCKGIYLNMSDKYNF